MNIEEKEFEKLKGKYKHYCWYWDDLAIDENCPEFYSCLCFQNSEEIDKLKDVLVEKY